MQKGVKKLCSDAEIKWSKVKERYIDDHLTPYGLII